MQFLPFKQSFVNMLLRWYAKFKVEFKGQKMSSKISNRKSFLNDNWALPKMTLKIGRRYNNHCQFLPLLELFWKIDKGRTDKITQGWLSIHRKNWDFAKANNYSYQKWMSNGERIVQWSMLLLLIFFWSKVVQLQVNGMLFIIPWLFCVLPVKAIALNL